MTSAFTLECGEDNVGRLKFNVADARVNTLSLSVLTDLEAIVNQLEGRTDIRGLVFASGKPGQFIAGADLRELSQLARVTREQALALLQRGQQLFNRVAALPFPTVALIDGACAGGGTELVLAMDYRIAAKNAKTQIGLPEVKIGVIPGWGGTQRLPRLIGVPNAIEMICSGELVGPERAVALGLVFDAVAVDRMHDAGRWLIDHACKTGEWRALRKMRAQPVGLSDDQVRFAFGVAEAQIRSKTKGQYPAPLVALKAIQFGCNRPLDEGLKAEIEASLEVTGSPVAANLIAVFFMTKRLERDSGVSSRDVQPQLIARAGVVGAGIMGAGITTAFARRGIPTTMTDVDDARIAAGLARCRDVIASRIKIGRASLQDMAEMLSRISTSTALAPFADADLVVEAIVENEAAKCQAYRQLASVMRSGALLASNTSTISISRLAASVTNPDRFCGMHFFNPVDRMQLVEVIRGEKTNDETIASVVALAKRVGKTPIVVRDCPGFLVNRVLFPYMTESLVLLAEGVSMDAIDKAATRFGMPMGPILLHDVVGLDTAAFAGNVIHEAYPDRALPIPLLTEMVQAGRLGQKSGAGFRLYDKRSLKGKPDPSLRPLLEKHCGPPKDMSDDELTNRLFLPMLLETTRVVEESIVREPGDADMGLILGIGFPAHRGGILRWCDAVGAGNVLKRLESFASLGKRFAPTALLEQNAKTGAEFYSA